MRIALISPRGTYFSRRNEFQKFIAHSSNLSSWRQVFVGLSPALLVIAALTPRSHEVVLVDENYEEVDFSVEYDLVAISAMTQQADRAYEIAGKFRKNGTKVVMGGIHATVLPDEAAVHVDSVVVGEVEHVWPQLLIDFAANRLSRRYEAERFVDLRESPIPRYDLLNPCYYRTIWIQTTRGCPRNCEFCAATRVLGAKYRHKSVEQVVKEITLVRSIFGSARIAFSDDNLFVDARYSKDLLEAITPLGIRFSCAVRHIDCGEGRLAPLACQERMCVSPYRIGERIRGRPPHYR